MESSSEQTDFMQLVGALKRLPAFQLAAFEQLVQDTDPTVVMRILARYCVNLQEAEGEIRRGLETENPEVVWRACHKLVGTAELLGFKEFGEKSRRLDMSIRASSDLHTHTEELQQYLREGRELWDQINSYCPWLKNYL